MSEHSAEHGDGHGGHAHEDHSSHYIKIWGILCVLLFISVAGPAVGELMPEGLARLALVLTTAFGIAFVKAFLVMKEFMHLNMELPYIRYMVATSVVLMALFFFAVAPDVMNHEGTNWVNVSAKAEVERGLAAGDGHGDHGDHGDGHDDHGADGHEKAGGDHGDGH